MQKVSLGDFKNIKFRSFVGKEPGPHLLVLAGVHGDEYEPICAAMKLMNIVPDVLTRGRVTIVPIVNIPAFKKISRTGEDGLDIARICPGNRNGTSSEIIAAEVSELIASSNYLIDLHTGGHALEISPLCGYMIHPIERVLNEQRRMAQAFNMKIVWGTSSKEEGRTLSVARDLNIPAVYTEFGGGGKLMKHVVIEYTQGCLNVLNTLGMSEGKSISGRCAYVVEDHTEGSGHLQRMHPAPADGFFEAEVELGDFVTEAQPIGTLTDIFSEWAIPIAADQAGMVFMLRAIPAVKKGDALGGVLSVDDTQNSVVRGSGTQKS